MNKEERSIFMLNEDCWRILLSYVSPRDVVNSERVCKQWYYRTQCYWQGVRVRLRSSLYQYRYHNSKPADPTVKCRTLSVHPKYYEAIIKRFGSSIMAADCDSEETFKLLREFCPNLRELKVANFDYESEIGGFHKLSRISFGEIGSSRTTISDNTIGRFLSNMTLAELQIFNNAVITGECLRLVQNNLKSLHIECCFNLRFNNLFSLAHRLSELTELKLNQNTNETLGPLSSLINKLPKLEYLGLELYPRFRSSCETYDLNIYDGEERYDFPTGLKRLVGAICRLSHLRHLSLFGNGHVTDEWLGAVGLSCRELRTVSVGACKGVSAEGVLALCRGAAGTLVALDVSYNDHITDDVVLRCIKYCPKLEMLDVQFCSLITESLAARAAESVRTRARPCACPRPGAPRLRIHMPNWLRTKVTYDDIILDYSGSNFKCQEYA